MSDASSDVRFGEALRELEEIVRTLEGGEPELEESLDLYQRGVELLRAARAKLADAEQRVIMLSGELEEIDTSSHPSVDVPEDD